VNRIAIFFAVLALAAGLWQIVLGSLFVFDAGWVMPLILFIMLLPLLPLILTQEVRPWPKPSPIVPIVAAVTSMAMSGLVYYLFYAYFD